MKNFTKTSTKCYNKTVTKTFSEQGNLINETTSETFTESDTIESNQLPQQTNNSKWYLWFNKPLNFILKAEGFISFCCYFKEPIVIHFLTLTVVNIRGILNV